MRNVFFSESGANILGIDKKLQKFNKIYQREQEQIRVTRRCQSASILNNNFKVAYIKCKTQKCISQTFQFTFEPSTVLAKNGVYRNIK